MVVAKNDNSVRKRVSFNNRVGLSPERLSAQSSSRSWSSLSSEVSQCWEQSAYQQGTTYVQYGTVHARASKRTPRDRATETDNFSAFCCSQAARTHIFIACECVCVGLLLILYLFADFSYFYIKNTPTSKSCTIVNQPSPKINTGTA